MSNKTTVLFQGSNVVGVDTAWTGRQSVSPTTTQIPTVGASGESTGSLSQDDIDVEEAVAIITEARRQNI